MMNINSTGARPRSVLALALALLAASALAPSPARAGLVVEVLNSASTPGGTGSFDVVLVDNGGTYAVSAFSIEPVVSAGSGVEFTSATANTTAASYLFGAYQSGPSPFATDPKNPNSTSPFPLTDFVASDADFASPYAITLNSGSEFGLAHVTYSVAPGTRTGPVAVSLGSAGTSLSDIDGDAIAFTSPAGTINVVPEPSSIVALSIGAACVASAGLRRRRATKAPG